MKNYLKNYCFLVLFFLVHISCNSIGKNINQNNFDCVKANQNIENYISKYKSTKDSTFLLRALPIIDTAIKYCNTEHYFFEKKVWIYLWLKKYDIAIELINKCEYGCDKDLILFQNDFGRNYYLKVLNILKYNNQKDTLNRNSTISQLLKDMKLSFSLYNNHPIDSSELNSLKCIPSVSPTKYEALLDYYTIRMLQEDKKKLLSEIEKISIDNDFDDQSLKNDLIDLIKNGKPTKFYEW